MAACLLYTSPACKIQNTQCGNKLQNHGIKLAVTYPAFYCGNYPNCSDKGARGVFYLRPDREREQLGGSSTCSPGAFKIGLEARFARGSVTS
jgi:hypothetical protein